MKKTSTVRVNGNMIFKGHKLTIVLDLGDRWSNYCVLDEAGEALLEQKLPTTPEAMKQTWKDGDRGGPARTEAIHRKERGNRKRKTLLTHTGLLMEGIDFTNIRDASNQFDESRLLVLKGAIGYFPTRGTVGIANAV